MAPGFSCGQISTTVLFCRVYDCSIYHNYTINVTKNAHHSGVQVLLLLACGLAACGRASDWAVCMKCTWVWERRDLPVCGLIELHAHTGIDAVTLSRRGDIVRPCHCQSVSLWLDAYMLYPLNNVHNCQMFPQLSCGGTCQIWTWYSKGNLQFLIILHNGDRSEKNGLVTPPLVNVCTWYRGYAGNRYNAPPQMPATQARRSLDGRQRAVSARCPSRSHSLRSCIGHGVSDQNRRREWKDTSFCYC